MSFESIKKIIDDIAAFIKSFTEQLKGFINGFKHHFEWNKPTGEDDHTEPEA